MELTRLPTPRRFDDTDRCDVLAEPLTLPRPGVRDELAACAGSGAYPYPALRSARLGGKYGVAGRPEGRHGARLPG